MSEASAASTVTDKHSFITQPNMYARGILFGKMKYELGDHAFVKCPELGLEADIDFKVKGWVGGTYNAFVGHIKDIKNNKNLYEITGFWDGEMIIKDLIVRLLCTSCVLSTDMICTDWQEGTIVRCSARKRDTTKGTTVIRARGTRVPTTVVQDHSCNQKGRPPSCH